MQIIKKLLSSLMIVYGAAIIGCLADKCREMDHINCKGYQSLKTYYCGHLWSKMFCKGMCGICDQDEEEENPCYPSPCKNGGVCAATSSTTFRCMCSGSWGGKYCDEEENPCYPNPCKNGGICAAISSKTFRCICTGSWEGNYCDEMNAYKWPRGNYGILSHDKCPSGWYEFTHCMDTEDYDNRDDVSAFTLGLGNICTESSVTFRYCFKGDEVPSRKTGFWVKTRKASLAYIIKANGSSCTDIGSEGGEVFIDNENDYNSNGFGNDGLNGKTFSRYKPANFDYRTDTRLTFCKIGEPKRSASSDYIEIGEFNKQSFGLFIPPGKICPKLMSPYGIMNGERQSFYIDDQDGDNKNKIVSGDPPIVFEDGNSRWAVCKYDPSNVEAAKSVVSAKSTSYLG